MPEGVSTYANLVGLAANVAALAIIVALAVWVRRNHIQMIELKASMNQVKFLVSLRLDGNTVGPTSGVIKAVEPGNQLEKHD